MGWDRALDEALGMQGLKGAWGALGMDLRGDTPDGQTGLLPSSLGSRRNFSMER